MGKIHKYLVGFLGDRPALLVQYIMSYTVVGLTFVVGSFICVSMAIVCYKALPLKRDEEVVVKAASQPVFVNYKIPMDSLIYLATFDSVTVYHAVKGQTDSTPFLTASHHNITQEDIDKRWLFAAPWGTIRRYNLKFGDTLYLFHERFRKRFGSKLKMVRLEDTMNRRYDHNDRGDILVPEDELGFWVGVKVFLKL